MSDSQASTSAGPSASSTAYPPSDDSSELESEETEDTLTQLWFCLLIVIFGLSM